LTGIGSEKWRETAGEVQRAKKMFDEGHHVGLPADVRKPSPCSAPQQ